MSKSESLRTVEQAVTNIVVFGEMKKRGYPTDLVENKAKLLLGALLMLMEDIKEEYPSIADVLDQYCLVLVDLLQILEPVEGLA